LRIDCRSRSARFRLAATVASTYCTTDSRRSTSPGSHLDQRARPVGGEGQLHVGDGFDLCRPEAVGDQRRQAAQASAQRDRLAHSAKQRLRLVEGEHAPALWGGVQSIGEEGLDPSTLV